MSVLVYRHGVLARPLGGAWSPGDIFDGWWRADLGHAYSDTDAVAAWANQGTAGTSADLSQATGTQQPIYDAVNAAANNQAVMLCDGSASIYAAAGTWWELSDGGSARLILVAGQNAGAGTFVVASTRQATTRGGYQLISNLSTGVLFDAYDEAAAHIVEGSNSAISSGTLAVLAGLIDADTADLWVDGAAGTTETDATLGAIGANLDREFILGSDGITGTGKFAGWIAEAFYIKRALTSGEDASLTAYLNTRYGLSLPGVTM
jgi:hypothetical protein